MRAIPVASVALLGVAVLSACAPAGAAGSDTFGFTVRPATVAPGGEVTLGVGRGAAGCRGRVTVTSPVFDTVTIPRHESSATARVDRDARRGAVYRVAFACKERSGTVDLTIAGGGSHRPTPEPHHSKGVHAGEGGSIAGFDLKQIGLGALLVAGSVGAAHHLSRRRSGERGA
ncbi:MULTISPECIES: hypothetical protein [Streptomyces]|uniref:hypothetical protein n=1 Tax=Streptomyces TaxID=1883 RepID=UPI001884D3CC|nr:MULTISPECIES: hypothetical protein [Streptomyces]MBF8170957.1 hypothetical protein [Streptomyces olivaceus]MBZ6136438.1 hypothetical protein [Streptomyces olivaceus]MBZ6163564.1 hypothetical protein [Streptomyces olivaceus]MBZ6171041.1 hypothetical protein [Streptomyces olivaceus]MBZ6177533.1 hypothetical protein [Streptomyces olivaceus]